MITLRKIEKQDKDTILGEIVGLSTDTKPTEMGGKTVANGSSFVEMDTGNIFLFDQANEEWSQFSGGSGGGGGSSSGGILLLEEEYDETADNFYLTITKEELNEAINNGKTIILAYSEEGLSNDALYYYFAGYNDSFNGIFFLWGTQMRTYLKNSSGVYYYDNL